MADQGLGVLGRALGQATQFALQESKREEQLELQRQQTKLVGDIVQSAVSYYDKMSASENAPTAFVKNRNVFKFISKQEAKAGLPLGTAMASYKKFFAGEDTGKPIKTTTSQGGFTNLYANGETEFVPFPEGKVLADEAVETRKTNSEYMIKVMQSSGEVYTEEQMIEMQKDPQAFAAKNAKFAEAWQRTASNKATEEQLNTLELQGKYGIEKAKQMYRSPQVTDGLYGIVQDLSKRLKEGTMEYIDAKQQLEGFILNEKKKYPEAYNIALGSEFDESLREILKLADPKTAVDYDRDLYTSRAQAVNSKIAVRKATANLMYFNEDPERLQLRVIQENLESLDPDIMLKMRNAIGMSEKEIYKKLGQGMEYKGAKLAKEEYQATYVGRTSIANQLTIADFGVPGQGMDDLELTDNGKQVLQDIANFYKLNPTGEELASNNASATAYREQAKSLIPILVDYSAYLADKKDPKLKTEIIAINKYINEVLR